MDVIRVTIQLPDDISAALGSGGTTPPRRSLEAIAVEAYRSGALTESQVRRLLGFESRELLSGRDALERRLRPVAEALAVARRSFSPQRTWETLVRTEGDGWLLPRFAPPPWKTIVRDMWDVTGDDDVRWMLDRLGPTPFGHLKDPVRRTNPEAEKLPRAYVRCLDFPNPRFDQHAGMARRGGVWRDRELAAPHHAAVTVPDKVTEVLLELAS
jgi:hypothetical protein